MNEMRCPYKILIADGGADHSIRAQLVDNTNYPYLTYEYISYPFDSTLKRYLKKLNDISSRVMTDYVLFADNDDFFLLDRIPEYISFLENNEQFVACGGSSCSLYLYDKNNVLVNSPYCENYRA
jgi:glycosyltransferase domain-containing protein